MIRASRDTRLGALIDLFILSAGEKEGCVVSNENVMCAQTNLELQLIQTIDVLQPKRAIHSEMACIH